MITRKGLGLCPACGYILRTLWVVTFRGDRSGMIEVAMISAKPGNNTKSSSSFGNDFVHLVKNSSIILQDRVSAQSSYKGSARQPYYLFPDLKIQFGIVGLIFS